MNKLIQDWWKEIDRFNFLIICILIIFGIVLSISVNSDSFFIIQKHLFYSIISIFLIILISLLRQKYIRRLSLAGLLIVTALMIAVLLLDYEVNGSKRWIKFYNFSLQPSEFLKPFFLLLSAWFLSRGLEFNRRYLYIVFVYFVFLAALLISQPDFGMTMLFTITFFCQLFIAGLSFLLIGFAIILILLLSYFSYTYFDHVKRRVDIFLDPNIENYQISQSLNAFKSGGFFGKGPGHGILKEKIPDAYNDFIFAVAGEEFGFIVCFLVILLFLIFIIRTLLKLLKINSPYNIIALVGLICSFGIQVLINISNSLGVIPTTGMTLPLVSYGGSSMISNAILLGFLLSLTRKNINE